MVASPRFKLPPPVALLLLVCLALAQPARAQRLAYSVGTTSAIIDLATGMSTPVSADEAQIGALFTSDGQYAARVVATGVLSVRHIPTGQQVSIATDFLPRLAHPRRPTLFGTSAGAPARFDQRGLVRWGVCSVPVPGPVLPMDLTLDGGRLFVLCQGDLIGLDTETGAEVSPLVAVGVAGPFAVNVTATEVIGWRSVGVPAELVRLSLTTGQLLASRVISGSAAGSGVWPTPNRRRVVATSCQQAGPDIACSPVIVDAASLTDVRALPVGGLPFFFGVEVSPDGRDAFVSGVHVSPSATFAAWVDVDTGSIVATSGAYSPTYLSIDYTPVPLPPASPVATVTGNSVTLSWQLPAESPQATGYRLDLGTRPGASDLGSISLGPAQTFTGAGVPPGRYYVRTRAVNYTGVSAPSAELVVDVP